MDYRLLSATVGVVFCAPSTLVAALCGKNLERSTLTSGSHSVMSTFNITEEMSECTQHIYFIECVANIQPRYLLHGWPEGYLKCVFIRRDCMRFL